MKMDRNNKVWTVRQQVIEDPASGLTIQFKLMPDGSPRLCIFGDLPFGNREFVFDKDGVEAGAGTALTGPCKPSWIREIEC